MLTARKLSVILFTFMDTCLIAYNYLRNDYIHSKAWKGIHMASRFSKLYSQIASEPLAVCQRQKENVSNYYYFRLTDLYNNH